MWGVLMFVVRKKREGGDRSVGAFYEVLGEFEEELAPGVVGEAAEGVIGFEAELASEFFGAGQGTAAGSAGPALAAMGSASSRG